MPSFKSGPDGPNRRTFIMGAAGLMAGSALLPERARAQSKGELIINSFGGAYEKAVRQAFVDPFTQKYNVDVIIDTTDQMETMAKIRASGGASDIDVVTADQIPVATLLNADLLEKMDPKIVTNAAKLYPSCLDTGMRWVSPHVGSIGIAYQTKHPGAAPTSWKDFWRPDYAGKIALPDLSVAWGPLYLVGIARAFGGDETNIEPAFVELAKIKSNIMTFFKAPDALLALMNQGDVAIAVWASDRVYPAKAGGSPIDYANISEGAMRNVATMAVPKGSKNKELAQQFINFVIDTDRQTEFCTILGYGPTNHEVKLSPELAATVPYGEAAVAKLQGVDVEVVNREWPGWIDRWNREIAS